MSERRTPVRLEASSDPLGTVNTMEPDSYVNHIPVLTGGVGREQVEAFYSQYLIPQAPPDIEIILISRTIGVDRLVDELMLERFLQDVEES